MRRDRIKIGMEVWAETLGFDWYPQPILCTVVGKEDHEYLLDSPSHGYVIRRGHREFQPAADSP